MTPAHGYFSPSQLSRIIACPGSVSLYKRAKPVEQQSEYAAEGNLLHEYMRQIVPLELFQNAYDWSRIPNPEHRKSCCLALDYVKYTLSVEDDMVIDKVLTEEEVSLPGSPVYGTCDLAVLLRRANDPDGKVCGLHVFDYKFGANIKVSADNNPQLMAYTLAVAEKYNRFFSYMPIIYIHIVQPRMNHYEEVAVTYNGLKNWFNGTLMPAIADAESERPSFHPSEEACRWCIAKAVCRACYNNAQAAAQQVFQTYALVGEQAHITRDELAAFYKNADVLEKQIKAVKEYVLTELLAGRSVPGYKVVRGRANRKWKDEGLVVKYLSEHYDADYEDIYETKLRSPAQIEKLYSGLAKDSEFKKLVMVPQGAPRVVESDAETPETNPFAEVTEKKI